MRFIDLSHTISNNTPVSPLDKRIDMQRVKFLNKDHYNDTKMISTMHIGTHIDAPSHMLDCETNISDYNIEKFIGKGVFLNFENEKSIELREEDKDKIVEDSIVLIHTGMDKNIGTEEYYNDHPQVSIELCKYLVEKKIKILALDFFSPDSFPSLIHKTLLSNDILIVENIKGADVLKGVSDFMLYMIPIKLILKSVVVFLLFLTLYFNFNKIVNTNFKSTDTVTVLKVPTAILVTHNIKIKKYNDNTMICSEFVKYMLRELGVLDQNDNHKGVLPSDFRILKDPSTFVYLYANLFLVK